MSKLVEIQSHGSLHLVNHGFAASWSENNQIAMLTEKGVEILELSFNPHNKTCSIECHRTVLATDMHSPTDNLGIDACNIFHTCTAQEVGCLLLNPDLAPSLKKTSAVLKVTLQTVWSPKGVVHYGRCLLACLTNMGQLTLYGTEIGQWMPKFDISRMWLRYFRKKWSVPNRMANIKHQLTELQYRAARIKITAVTWERFQGDEYSCSTLLITASQDGIIALWLIEDENYKKSANFEPITMLISDGLRVKLMKIFDSKLAHITSLLWNSGENGSGILIAGNVKGIINSVCVNFCESSVGMGKVSVKKMAAGVRDLSCFVFKGQNRSGDGLGKVRSDLAGDSGVNTGLPAGSGVMTSLSADSGVKTDLPADSEVLEVANTDLAGDSGAKTDLPAGSGVKTGLPSGSGILEVQKPELSADSRVKSDNQMNLTSGTDSNLKITATIDIETEPSKKKTGVPDLSRFAFKGQQNLLEVSQTNLTSKAEPNPTSQTQPNLTSEVEHNLPSQPQLNLTSGAEPDLTAQQQYKLTSEAEPNLISGVEPNQTSQPQPNITSESEPNPTSQQQQKPTSEAEPGPISEAEPNQTSEAEPNFTSESESNPTSGTKSNLASETEPNLTSQPEPNLTSKAESNLKTPPSNVEVSIEVLWPEEDLLAVTSLTCWDADNSNLCAVCIKGTHIIVLILQKEDGKLVSKHCHNTRKCNLTGLIKLNNAAFLIGSQQGAIFKLTLVQDESGVVTFLNETVQNNFIKSRFGVMGLAASRNRAFIAVNVSLNGPYDRSKLKQLSTFVISSFENAEIDPMAVVNSKTYVNLDRVWDCLEYARLNILQKSIIYIVPPTIRDQLDTMDLNPLIITMWLTNFVAYSLQLEQIENGTESASENKAQTMVNLFNEIRLLVFASHIFQRSTLLLSSLSSSSSQSSFNLLSLRLMHRWIQTALLDDATEIAPCRDESLTKATEIAPSRDESLAHVTPIAQCHTTTRLTAASVVEQLDAYFGQLKEQQSQLIEQLMRPEVCLLCGDDVPVSADFSLATCNQGHQIPRCSLSMVPIPADFVYLICQRCGVLAHPEAVSADFTTCVFCNDQLVADENQLTMDEIAEMKEDMIEKRRQGLKEWRAKERKEKEEDVISKKKRKWKRKK